MKFEITRASTYSDYPAESPCYGAYREGDDWYINIETLDDLIKLSSDSNSELIFSGHDSVPFIQIYDDYVE